jgi:hypothetical protein
MKFLWALALIFCADLALPMAPGAWQPLEPRQSVEVARRLTVQAAAAVAPPSLQPRFPATAQHAPRISMAHVARRESTPSPVVVPLARSPQQVEAEALNAVDPA